MPTTSTGTTGSRAGRAPGTGVLLVDTRDVDAARHQVATSYCPHALTVRGDGRGFHARHTTAGGEGVAVHRLGYGRDAVVVEPEPFGDFVLVSRPLRGILAVETGSEEVVVGAGSPVLLDPHDHHVLRFGPDCELLTVKLPRAAVERAAREVHPRGAGRVRTATAADPAAWDAVSRFLLTDAVGRGLVGGPGGGVAGGAFERQVVGLAAAALVRSFAPAPTEVAESSRTASEPASLRRALEFIDAHAAGAAGLREVAAAAGCSPRALQEAFRRHLDTTPTAHLRARRLAGARSELLEHPERSVAEVAHAWGFLHLGRFAAAYRREFGELPSRDRADGTSRAQRTGPGAAGS